MIWPVGNTSFGKPNLPVPEVFVKHEDSPPSNVTTPPSQVAELQS